MIDINNDRITTVAYETVDNNNQCHLQCCLAEKSNSQHVKKTMSAFVTVKKRKKKKLEGMTKKKQAG